MVSPTLTSLAFLIPEIKYPTFPDEISFLDSFSSLRIPISSTSYSLPVLTNFTLSPFLIFPLKTLNKTSIPLKELYTESKIIACNSLPLSPSGDGTFFIISLTRFSIPIPSFALTCKISSFLQPIKSIT